MSDQSPPSPHWPEPTDASPDTVLEPGQTVSVADAPEGWVDAEQHAPAAGTPLTQIRRRTKRSTVPVRHEGTFIANVVAAATGFVSAAGWYFLDVLDLYEGPWTPVLIALIIAGPVRFFSKANPTHRSVVSTLSYLLVLLIVLILLTHRDLVSIYGAIDDYSIYEQSIVRSRLQDPLHLAAYGIGGILAALIPQVGERR